MNQEQKQFVEFVEGSLISDLRASGAEATADDFERAVQIIRDLSPPENQIAITWMTSDVLGVRPDLTQEQAMAVLCEVEHRHDASIGINWEVIEIHADLMFPRPPGSKRWGDGEDNWEHDEDDMDMPEGL